MPINSGIKTADLHVHTSFSDGILEPATIVKKAVDLGLSAIAVTDHDCVDAVDIAIKASANTDLEIVPGVELSVYIEDKEAHLLGYFIDIKNAGFISFLEGLKRRRKERVFQMISLLEEKGILIDPGKFIPAKETGTVGRMNLARALYDQGFVGSVKEAFDKYIGNGKSCYVQHFKLSYIDGIDLINSSGGVPVLAHPGTIGGSSYIIKCVSAGLKGLEIYHPKHKPHQVLQYEKLAREKDLIFTGGSDCHGMPLNDNLLLGTVTVSYETVDDLRKLAGRSYD